MNLDYVLGISAGYHDAAATVIRSDGEIAFASHSERYSKEKNDSQIHINMLDSVVKQFNISTVAYYEIPWKKQLRQLYSGQGVEWDKLITRQVLKKQIGAWVKYPNKVKIKTYGHHLSHAAAGFQTSPYDRATVVVIDAIGEWDTISIWAASYANGQAQYKRLWRQRYPNSIGLFYSAITNRLGLRPMDEEYITMGMSAYGEPKYTNTMRILAEENLHVGTGDMFLPLATDADIAASAQAVVEELIYSVMRKARAFNWSTNLVYMGGVALNCLANRNLGQYFENVWIMPNPGDAGSSLGAAALAYGGKVNFTHAYLGHNIPGAYPVDNILSSLLSDKICGVASGRAEFGPRALGNRSLLADPRGTDIKDRVNVIKQRQQFRPFAPVILEEHVMDYFDLPSGFSDTRYMQVVGRCRHPDLFPAIVHVDGTSRIQTVPQDGSGIRQLLEAWYAATGCPMLLNTSLNIRGEPMVNDRKDADRFEDLYEVKVHS
jgi:carbamoyltransferase